ncbi:MAG: flagellar export protein FliJ [Deltaproteobacteria bacterium GWC2_56_8]|nr:MAG: flagellar export protein FliJ [Deltaproteobacteria bacterium GWC2_56_8]
MNKFVFKLEPLFEYRERLKELSQKEFGEALKRLEDEETKLSDLKGLYKKSSSDIDALKENGAPFDEIELSYSYVVGLKRHIAGQEQCIAECRRSLEAKRGELLEASKKTKVMEIMKEKSRLSYNEKANKDEQKATDDLTTSRFKRGAGDEK